MCVRKHLRETWEKYTASKLACTGKRPVAVRQDLAGAVSTAPAMRPTHELSTPGRNPDASCTCPRPPIYLEEVQ